MSGGGNQNPVQYVVGLSIHFSRHRGIEIMSCTLCLLSCSQVLAASPLKGDATERRGDRISLFTHYECQI